MNTQTQNEATTEETVDVTTQDTEDTTEDTGSETTESTEETSPEPLQAKDYKAETEKLQKKLADVNFKLREAKRGKESEEPEQESDDEDRALTKAELAAMLDERDAKNQRMMQESKVSSVAESLTESADEAAYAMELWRNVNLSFIDSPEEQMRFIVAGMNHDRTLAQNNELKRSLKSKDTANRNTATTARDAQKANEPKVEGDMKAVLNKQGFKYNNDKKAFAKKLANGKMMFADGKGKTWVE